MLPHASAIVRAQWRSSRNFYARHGLGGSFLGILLSSLWYGLVLAGAAAVAVLLSNPRANELAVRVLPSAFYLAFLYWQVVPVLLASTGATLDMRRILVYPVPRRQLFFLEVLLRVSTGVEMLLLMGGVALGLLLNPTYPAWRLLALGPFALFNLLLSCGVKSLLSRIFAGRRARELVVVLVVLAAALPQWLLMNFEPERMGRFLADFPLRGLMVWPWTAGARAVLGQGGVLPWLLLLSWCGAAWLFGRWQFERSLRMDTGVEPLSGGPNGSATGPWEWFYRLPGALLPDPLAAIVEKELRFLSRAPRFRLVFLMGFSFGLLVWLPIAFGGPNGAQALLAGNYLTFVSVYALMLLGEVSLWNSFGFDRAAAQVYYLAPVSISRVLIGKNIAAAVFVLLEVSAVAMVCGLLRMPVSVPKLAEAYAVTLVMAIYLMAVGNLGSTRFPRPVDPARPWRSASAGNFQALLLVLYPVIGLPVLLAYGARFAFQSEAAFYLVLALSAAVGGILYWVAMDSAVAAAGQRKEAILEALAAGEGPVAG